jgi:uncharacterized protein (DUF952 family)/(2Fe-2S) ferredoxin
MSMVICGAKGCKRSESAMNQNSSHDHFASTPTRNSVLVCQHLTCRKQGAPKVLAAFRQLKTPNVIYEGCGCLGNCGNGPMVLILPARIWYYLVQPHDVPKIAAVLSNSMNTILHITHRQAWATAKDLGTYRSNTLDSEGFIHCSTVAQVIGSANRFFKDQTDLVILEIDVDRVTPEIRYEGADSTNLFPHIYGALNIDAVIRSIDLESHPDGSFILPPEFVN